MTDLAPLAAPVRSAHLSAPLAIAPGEVWCTACGSSGAVLDAGVNADTPDAARRCIYCGSSHLVPAVQVLHPGEYVTV